MLLPNLPFYGFLLGHFSCDIMAPLSDSLHHCVCISSKLLCIVTVTIELPKAIHFWVSPFWDKKLRKKLDIGHRVKVQVEV